LSTTTLSRRELAAREHQEAIEKKKEEERRLQDMVERIRRQDTPYGRELAEKVADALQHGPLFFSHRDYCGMGLEVGTSGEYLYGEVFDGGMINVVQHFPDRADFVDWLAAQSNASMAMLDAKETWYWNNQVITRQRLEDFIRKS